MVFRRTTLDDMESIMCIIRQAQSYLRNKGINQWQNNYPNEDIIKKDIQQGNSYILSINNQIVATVAVSFDGEKTYDKIYDGEWLTEGNYAVIHRIAVDDNYKGQGLSHRIMERIAKLCRDNMINSIRVDTHEENESMKKMLINNGFNYCGKIFLVDGAQRVAYEKLI